MRIIYLKYKVYVLAVFGLVIIIALIYFLLLPKFNQLLTYQQKLQESNQKLSNLEWKMSEIQRQKDELMNLKEKLSRVETLVPKKINDADLIAQVDALASETNLELSSIAVTQTDAKEADKVNLKAKSQVQAKQSSSKSPSAASLKQVRLQVSVAGEFANIEAFIEQLGLLDRLGNVYSVTFNPGEDGLQAGIDAYFYLH